MKLTLPLLAAAAMLLGASVVQAADTPAMTNATSDKNPSMSAGKTQNSDPQSPTTDEATPSAHDNPAATAGKTEDSDPQPK